MSWLSTLAGVLFIGNGLFGEVEAPMLGRTLGPQDINVAAAVETDLELMQALDRQAGVAALQTGTYNAVVLSEAIPMSRHVESGRTAKAVASYLQLARAARPEARLFLVEGWHDLRSGTGAELRRDSGADIPWLERIEKDLSVWQGVLDAVNSERAASAEPVRLIPAAQALLALNYEVKDGALPGIRRIEDFFTDSLHPNDLGSYFLTMVAYATITGESPVGLPRRMRQTDGTPFLSPNPLQAQRLQQIAWSAVRNYQIRTPAPPMPLQRQTSGPENGAELPKVPLAESLAAPAEPENPVPLGLGLAEINDWSVQQPFLDVFKTARPWIGHKPGEYGGSRHWDLEKAGYLDEHGWPVAIPPELSSIGTLILTDLPTDALSTQGRYRLTFEGTGIVEVGGLATNVRYGPNTVEFDFAPKRGFVDIRIQRTDSNGDYVRNIKVVKLEFLDAYQAGSIFNPLWLERMEGFSVLRFMGWMLTNATTQSTWADHPHPDDYTYFLKGAPVQIMVELLNQTGTDGWFNMPHIADDDYVRRFAEYVRDNLGQERKAYLELSNEVWNWEYPQAQWAGQNAQDRWGNRDLWVTYYTARAIEMSQIWSQVYGDEAADRLVRVISSQTGWPGLETQVFEAKEWRAESLEHAPPATYFDAYAITGYFGGRLGFEDREDMVRGWLSDSLAAAQDQARQNGLSVAEYDEFVEKHRYDIASAQAWAELRDGASSGDPLDTLAAYFGELLPYHAEIARQNELELMTYEAGTHLKGFGSIQEDEELTRFFMHFNYTPEMGDLYTELISGWSAAGGTVFNAFQDVYPANKYGSWGHLRHLLDENPRWDALTAFQ